MVSSDFSPMSYVTINHLILPCPLSQFLRCISKIVPFLLAEFYFRVRGIKLRTSCLPGRRCAAKLYSWPPVPYLFCKTKFCTVLFHPCFHLYLYVSATNTSANISVQSFHRSAIEGLSIMAFHSCLKLFL